MHFVTMTRYAFFANFADRALRGWPRVAVGRRRPCAGLRSDAAADLRRRFGHPRSLRGRRAATSLCSIYSGLVSGGVASWVVVLGPYGLYLLFRAILFAWRAGSSSEAADR